MARPQYHNGAVQLTEMEYRNAIRLAERRRHSFGAHVRWLLEHEAAGTLHIAGEQGTFPKYAPATDRNYMIHRPKNAKHPAPIETSGG